MAQNTGSLVWLTRSHVSFVCIARKFRSVRKEIRFVGKIGKNTVVLKQFFNVLCGSIALFRRQTRITNWMRLVSFFLRSKKCTTSICSSFALYLYHPELNRNLCSTHKYRGCCGAFSAPCRNIVMENSWNVYFEQRQNKGNSRIESKCVKEFLCFHSV